jgi:hypothetical protein
LSRRFRANSNSLETRMNDSSQFTKSGSLESNGFRYASLMKIDVAIIYIVKGIPPIYDIPQMCHSITAIIATMYGWEQEPLANTDSRGSVHSLRQIYSYGFAVNLLSPTAKSLLNEPSR